MDDAEHSCIASPPDTSVTSSTCCADDRSVKPLHMSHNLHSSDEDAEVSSSCEMHSAPPSFPSTAVDPLNNPVTYLCDLHLYNMKLCVGFEGPPQSVSRCCKRRLYMAYFATCIN